MQDAALVGSARDGRGRGRRWTERLHDFLPRGNTLDGAEWRRRHRLLEWVLLFHVPALIGVGVALGHPPASVGAAVVAPLTCLGLGHVVRHRRWASFFVTGGLVFCSVTLVLLTRGSIEAHFHFFVIIGFIALYQDWVPFLWNVTFTVLSHGIGTVWLGGEQIFNHPAAQEQPWLWSLVHGVAVLAACVGMVLFWRITEEEQEVRKELSLQLVTANAEAEIGRRQFTADLLVNLARRNQSMLYRQLDIINQLEDKERDPDALADLFKIDHLATRIRRNAESLLVLAGEQPPRIWSAPVALRDVVRAAIAETEDLDRVVFAVDDRVSVTGGSVADLTHLLAELTENAVRFSPPETVVTIRARPNRREDGGQLLTVEDWGVGMPPDDLAEANDLLARPREVDVSVSQRLGFHVVARLAARHGIAVSLTATPGSGITAVAILPPALFTVARPVSDLGPAAVDPATTIRLPVAGKGAGTEQAGLDDPGQARAETVNGTDVGPVRNGRPAHPVSEPVMPAADRGAGTAGQWSGWWFPERVTEGRAANGAAPEADGPGQAPRPDERSTVDDRPGPDEHRGDESPSGGEHPDTQGPGDVQEPEDVREPADADEGGRARDDVDEPGTVRPDRTLAAAGAVEVPHARVAAVPQIPAPAGPPTPGHRTLTAVPHPRTEEPAGPGPRGPQPGAPGRGLRRRVPQTHLAPELRLAANGLAATAPSPAADAAASALSRYQASRRVAQAVVGAPSARPDGEGARA